MAHLALAALGLALTACSLLLLDDFSGGSTAAGNDASTEGAAQSDGDAADDASVDAGPVSVDAPHLPTEDAAAELLSNGGFETDGEGCGPGWDSLDAELSRVNGARSGSTACQACTSGAGAFGISRTFQGGNFGPGNYEFSAYVFVPIGADEVIPAHALSVDIQNANGDITSTPSAELAPPRGQWQRIAVTVNVTAGMHIGYLDIVSKGGAPSCVVIDDVSLVAQP